MAKNNKLKWLVIIVPIMVLFAGVVGTWAIYGEDIEDNQKAVTGAFKAVKEAKSECKEQISILKKDGCDPARDHKTEIAVLKSTMKVMQIEQREGFKAILERLPK